MTRQRRQSERPENGKELMNKSLSLSLSLGCLQAHCVNSDFQIYIFTVSSHCMTPLLYTEQMAVTHFVCVVEQQTSVLKISCRMFCFHSVNKTFIYLLFVVLY